MFGENIFYKLLFLIELYPFRAHFHGQVLQAKPTREYSLGDPWGVIQGVISNENEPFRLAQLYQRSFAVYITSALYLAGLTIVVTVPKGPRLIGIQSM
jgi:hypothetical protein